MDGTIVNVVDLEYVYTFGTETDVGRGAANTRCTTTVVPNIIIIKAHEFIRMRARQQVYCQISIENQSELPMEIFLFDKLPLGFRPYSRSYQINGFARNIQNAFAGYRVGILDPYARCEVSYIVYNNGNSQEPTTQVPPAQVMYRIANSDDDPKRWAWQIS